jgi:hypothetical protein
MVRTGHSRWLRYLRVDIRADWAMLCLQTATVGWVTEAYVEPVRKISTLVDQSR